MRLKSQEIIMQSGVFDKSRFISTNKDKKTVAQKQDSNGGFMVK